MLWLAAAAEDPKPAFSFTGQKIDHYNLLVDGFLAGQTYLKAEVHPGRWSDDPEERKRSPFLIDASYHNGRYYLYYGVVPAVAILLPYSALTGHDLSLNTATLGFVLIGFWTSIVWYFRVRNSIFPGRWPLLDCAAIVLLAFGPATTFLVRRSYFYELPLAAGYALFSIFLWATTHALTSQKRSERWIAVASASVGLAAGCHPNYALLCPFIALTAWWCRPETGPERRRTADWPLILAAILPAAAIGSGLAWYNYVRFADPFEFGFNYGLNPLLGTGQKVVNPDFIVTNLIWYYLTPPSILPYFPFVYPINATFLPAGYHGSEEIHGQFFTFLLLCWTAFGALVLRGRGSLPKLLSRLSWILTGAAVVSAMVILVLGIRANRYMVDFQFPLIALSLLFLIFIYQEGRKARWFGPWLSIWMVGLACAGAHNVLAAVQQFEDFRNARPVQFERISRLLNPSWAFWERMGLVDTGTARFSVVFQAQSRPVAEPLLTLGVPGYSDSLYAIQHPGGRLEFHLNHFRHGGPKSRVVTYEPGRRHSLEVTLGSFFPPITDPAYQGLTAEEIEWRKSSVRVVFDGEVVLEQRMRQYDAAPWQREYGSNLTSATGMETRFSGQLDSISWNPPASYREAEENQSPFVRLRATFAAVQPGSAQPILGFGVSGAGTLLFMRPAGKDLWTFGVDEWGYGAHESAAASIAPGDHVIDIFIGPRIIPGEAALETRRNHLMVWLDGQKLADFTLSQLDRRFQQVSLGSNPQGFSTSDAIFHAPLAEQALSDSDQSELLARVNNP